MAEGITCLVTLHGMGFQHAPQAGSPGYADRLQSALEALLPDLLSGDPLPEFGRPAGEGAIYVHSEWPPGSGKVSEGLSRLGTWAPNDLDHRIVDISGAPLTDGTHSIAHVALVYAGLEAAEPFPGSTVETLFQAAIAHERYAGLFDILRLLAVDSLALLRSRVSGNTAPTPSLSVRAQPGSTAAPSGLSAVLEALAHDVVSYVTWNALRERVRSFLHEALLRISLRDDVAHVVVNSHSQGTVASYDVLRAMTPLAASKLSHYVTAGSPLRKYVDLFYWGSDAGSIPPAPWTNFWDATDPVADPLVPPQSWRPGTNPPVQKGSSALIYSVNPDTGRSEPVPMADQQVDNAAHGAGGSLPAHNYWDNEEQFVKVLAEILQSSVAR